MFRLITVLFIALILATATTWATVAFGLDAPAPCAPAMTETVLESNPDSEIQPSNETDEGEADGVKDGVPVVPGHLMHDDMMEDIFSAASFNRILAPEGHR